MESSVPALETVALSLGGETPLEVGSLVAKGPKVALWDDSAALLQAMIDDTRIASGSLLLFGQPAQVLLASGKAAYVPKKLPLPGSVKLLDAMTLSARLVGLTKSDARRALGRCRLGELEKKRLGELTPLQSRLACIAHGISSFPRVLLLDNVFADLDEPESAVVEATLEAELEDRSVLVACRARDPSSRTLALNCDEAITTAGNQVLPPSKPRAKTAPGYWVSCTSEAAPLAGLLESQGAEVARSPRPSVLLVRRATGATIYRAARECGLVVLELTPAGLA